MSLFGFVTNVAKAFNPDVDTNSQSGLATDSAASYEADWARRLRDDEGIKSAEARQGQRTILDERLASSQITPADAITGVIARQTERRNIRLQAAAQAKALGWLYEIKYSDIIV